MFNNFKYYLKQAFSGIYRNKLMVVISASTIVFSMLLLGLSIVFGSNLGYISDQLEASFEIHAFVDLSYSEEAARSIEPKISSIENIFSCAKGASDCPSRRAGHRRCLPAYRFL